jgi:tetratricopeptide (TPR) repeat protein
LRARGPIARRLERAFMSGLSAGAADAARSEGLQAVAAAVQAGDLVRAKALACQVLAQGIEHPALLNLRALRAEEEGRLQDALADLRRAHALAPRDFSVLNALGLCLARLDRYRESIEAYEQGLAIEPRFAPLWFNRGAAFERCGDIAVAKTSYETAVECDARHPHAHAALAGLGVRRGDLEAGRRFAERALALDPGQTAAALALAEIEVGDGRLEAAQARLRAVLARPNLSAAERGLALGQLGDVLDALRRPPEAFAAYVAGNRELRLDARPRFESAGMWSVSAYVGRLIAHLESAGPGIWESSAPGEGAGERGHVFLMGFPRSGTTLLENVLAADPDVVSLEEKETMSEAVRGLMRDPGDLSRLAALSGAELESFRNAYWRRVREFGADVRGKVLIDKNPLNTHKLPLISRLFPRARILFAVRDPRDVVWSCFRRRFTLNASMYELLDLEGAARLYDLTMRLHALCSDRLGLVEHKVRYEALVEDFEAEAARACRFIGIEPGAGLSDFSARARRGEVATPSAAQLARGLFKEGVGQWRAYAAELAPVLPILAPWVERFGYPRA